MLILKCMMTFEITETNCVLLCLKIYSGILYVDNCMCRQYICHAPLPVHKKDTTPRFLTNKQINKMTAINCWRGQFEVLRIVQKQHDGVELLSGSIVCPQRDDEVVETVSSRLCRHYNQLILETVGLCILKAVVCAALGRERKSVRL